MTAIIIILCNMVTALLECLYLLAVFLWVVKGVGKKFKSVGTKLDTHQLPCYYI